MHFLHCSQQFYNNNYSVSLTIYKDTVPSSFHFWLYGNSLCEKSGFHSQYKCKLTGTKSMKQNIYTVYSAKTIPVAKTIIWVCELVSPVDFSHIKQKQPQSPRLIVLQFSPDNKWKLYQPHLNSKKINETRARVQFLQHGEYKKPFQKLLHK